MYQVFLSHRTDELALLQGLVDALTRVGIGVYIAERSPMPGAYLYDQKIIPAIINADCTLVLLTSNSATSPDVNQEIGIARSHNKPIIALVETGVPLKVLLSGREVVYFDRQNPGPALLSAFEHFRNQAVLKERAQAEDDKNTAILIGGIALFVILAAAANKK